MIAPDSNGKTSSYQRVMTVSSQDKRHCGLWVPWYEPNTVEVEPLSIWMLPWANYLIVKPSNAAVPLWTQNSLYFASEKKLKKLQRIDSTFSFKMNDNSRAQPEVYTPFSRFNCSVWFCLLYSTEGAFRLPTTYDNHPIPSRPTYSTEWTKQA